MANAGFDSWLHSEVFCDSHMDATMPTVALFASKKIEAYTELRFDYGPTSEFAAHIAFEAKAIV
jgi:hypothetical protein